MKKRSRLIGSLILMMFIAALLACASTAKKDRSWQGMIFSSRSR